MGHKHICLPFASEGQYREYVDDPAQYRQYLGEMLRQYPEGAFGDSYAADRRC